MLNQYAIKAVGVFVLIGGTVGGTIGYGSYYRSDRYRREVEGWLTEFFGLPVDVADVEPHSFTARRLMNISMWLPDRRARIFLGPRVIWDDGGTPEQAGTVIRVHHADLAIGSEDWESGDYMRVLQASLAHNFDQLDIREVHFHHARIAWPREDFQLVADDVDGVVTFDAQGNGQARMTCHRLNEIDVAEPIQIFARIDPLADAFLPEVTLIVPTLPLPALGLDEVLQSPVTQGTFAGKITLRQFPDGNELELSGSVRNVQLAELTQRLPSGRVTGRMDVKIERALIRDRNLEYLSFSGQGDQMNLDAVLTRFGFPSVGGRIRLGVLNGRIEEGRLAWIRLNGGLTDGSLDALSRAWLGKPGVQGRLTLQLNNLFIEGDRPISGDIELSGRPAPGQKGLIHRALLAELLRTYLDVALPERLLPETIEFVHLGAVLRVERGNLRVLSAEGPAGRAIVTARLFGRDLALLGDVDVSLPLDPMIERARRRIKELEPAWRERLKIGADPPATRPAEPSGG